MMRDPDGRPRHMAYCNPRTISDLDAARAAWYESDLDQRLARAAARRRDALLRWVRWHMASELTERERVCVDLYYFEGLTFAEAAERTGTNASSVCRAVHRALRRLRLAAKEDTTWRAYWSFPRRPTVGVHAAPCPARDCQAGAGVLESAPAPRP